MFDRTAFDAALALWPGVTLADQWEARIAKVGGKVFCLLSDAAPHRLVFKCGETSFNLLTGLEGIGQAPYFARRMWVSVEQSAPLTEAELAGYIGRSYALVARRLTRKLRTELGIPDDFGDLGSVR